MAIEIILVKTVIEVLKKMVIPVVGQNVSSVWSFKDDLKKLQDTLELIHAKIADAEMKQEQNNELQLWLKRLKDVAYDADDIIDDFSYEIMRRSGRESFKLKARDFISSSNPLAFRLKLTKQIKGINYRVNQIAKDMHKFHLQTTDNNTIVHGESSEQRRQTASSIIGSENVGRKDDKNKIVDILTKATASSSSDLSYHSSEKISIISIVGMGGLGKTTLAQLVYNDEWVTKHFDQRMWVCISTNFDVEIILVKIMESITLAKFDSVSNFDLLVNMVQEKLQDTKFLLVLDDMWNEDAQQWERLKGPLLVGAQGSKILITTRNMQVADVVKGSIPPYKLQKLQEDECWSIMEKRAFSPGGALKTPNMTDIGKEIAKKCGGLPLAAKFLGSLMHSKNKESDWLSIRATGIWNTQEGQIEIRPILKLSYDNLSPHLKQCFSYCSIFPKGGEIKKETLINLWMAEGFLEAPSTGDGNARSIEVIGEEYFDSLVWSSFLDVAEKNDLEDIIACKMHDLVHDLGRDVVGNRECAVVKTSELENISNIRRLRLIFNDDLRVNRFKALSEFKMLRTIIVPEPAFYSYMYKFSSNKKLRVLHYDRSADGSQVIPCLLANELRHLRYVYGVMLDDLSIKKLYNLQTLVLSGCHSVHNLLANMESLINLRFLDISYLDIRILPDSVTSLCNLQKLNLSHCTNLTFFPNQVTGLKYLKYLDMSFTPIQYLPAFVIKLSNLQTLDVNSCVKLISLPDYVAGLANLRIFNFKNCQLLEALPKDFGALTQLRYLNLDGTNIEVLPESCANLNNLEYVNLFRCNLPKEVTNWIRLRTFYYKHRDNQEILLGVGKLIFLRQLIYSVPEKLTNDTESDFGIEELRNLNFLEGLNIMKLENVKDPNDAIRANLEGKQNLRVLSLHWGETEEEDEEVRWWDAKPCDDLQVFEALQAPTGLTELSIHNFMGLDLPTWMCLPSGLRELENLHLVNCRGIEQLPEAIGQLPRLKSLYLSGMPLKSLDIGAYHCLQDLRISGCKSLTEIPSFPSLAMLELEEVGHNLVCSVGRRQVSLTTLFLKNIEQLIYFPISILQSNCNLQVVSIEKCNQFEGFGVNSDENENVVAPYRAALFGSLQKLELIDCPVFEVLPDIRGLSSLQKLALWGCPKVDKSLKYDLKSLTYLKELYVNDSINLRRKSRREVITHALDTFSKVLQSME